MTTMTNHESGRTSGAEARSAQGERNASAIGFTYRYDSRLTGLDPTAGFLVEIGADYAGIGGDSEYIKATTKLDCTEADLQRRSDDPRNP